jgi:transposase
MDTDVVGQALSGAPKVGEVVDNCGAVLLRDRPADDLRERVMAAVDSGTGVYAAASIFQVSVSYIYKVLGRRERTGETSARPWAGGSKPKLAAHDEALRACHLPKRQVRAKNEQCK